MLYGSYGNSFHSELEWHHQDRAFKKDSQDNTSTFQTSPFTALFPPVFLIPQNQKVVFPTILAVLSFNDLDFLFALLIERNKPLWLKYNQK